jgi:hypothetical protein
MRWLPDAQDMLLAAELQAFVAAHPRYAEARVAERVRAIRHERMMALTNADVMAQLQAAGSPAVLWRQQMDEAYQIAVAELR